MSKVNGVLFAVCFGIFDSTLSSTAQALGHVDKSIRHSVEPIPPKHFGNDVIYQIMVDRFANGTVANDCIHGGRYCQRGGSLDWYRYWGGDLLGIQNQLPYLKDLGVSRVWLTPLFENAAVTVKFGNSVVTSYHGYWVRDWFRLNPYFTTKGTSTDFDSLHSLLDSAYPHIRIYLDTVLNHTSPSNASDESLQYLNEIEPISSSVPFPHKGALFENGTFTTGFDQDRFGPREYFHPYTQIIGQSSTPHEVEVHQLSGLADLDQSKPLTFAYLQRAHAFWMERFPKLAGYRIDTIKHVAHSFWRSFLDDLYSKFEDLETFGEYWGASAAETSSHPYYLETQSSLLDFAFRDHVRAVLGPSNESFSKMVKYWEKDARIKNAEYLITYLDSHDLPRLRSVGVSYKRMRQAIGLLLTSRGIPCLYYGIEQDLYSDEGIDDPYNRPMMEFQRDPELFSYTRELIHLRKRNRALRYGWTHVIHETDHILAFERIDGEDKVLVILSKNARAQGDDFSILGSLLPDGQYADVLMPQRRYQVSGGAVPVHLFDGDIVVLSTH